MGYVVGKGPCYLLCRSAFTGVKTEMNSELMGPTLLRNDLQLILTEELQTDIFPTMHVSQLENRCRSTTRGESANTKCTTQTLS